MAAPEIIVARAHANNYTVGRAGQQVRAIVNHISQGGLDSTLSWFRSPVAQVSSNYVIAGDGTIYEVVPPDWTAHTNGNIRQPNTAVAGWLDEGPWAPVDGERVTANTFTCSIEWIGQHQGGRNGLVAYQGKTLQINPLPGSVLRFYTPTEEQYQAGLALHRWLLEYFDLPAARSTVLRHSDLDNISRWFCPDGRHKQPGTPGGFDLARLLGDLGDPAFAKAATVVAQPPATYRVTGPPTVSLPVFEQFLRTRQSPLLDERPAFEYYNAVTAAGVDPNLALAMWWHEGQAGKDGAAARNRNIGNLRPRKDGTIGRAVDISFDYFRMYRNWLDGVRDWAELLGGPAYRDLDVRTAIGVYAPASDGNTPEHYVKAVLSIMAALAEASDKGGGGG
jgi:N-acetyl-anhydromuramyl-L-alanine amidase AmpD